MRPEYDRAMRELAGARMRAVTRADKEYVAAIETDVHELIRADRTRRAYEALNDAKAIADWRAKGLKR